MKNLLLLLAMIACYAASAWAGTAFLTGEKVSGMNKICYYDSLNGTVAITIDSVELCPISIDIP